MIGIFTLVCVCSQAELNKTAIYRKQSEILKLVVASYFRVMKNAASSEILPNALEVQTVYHHRINIQLTAVPGPCQVCSAD